MPTPEPRTGSRRLMHDSRVLIAEARAVLFQARQALARQCYRQIVCAWCAQPMRWERCAQSARGQISHSICFDCWAGVFQELEPGAAMPACPQQGVVVQRTPKSP